MATRTVQDGTEPAGKFHTDVLKELQSLKSAVVAGAAADTDIAVTGLNYTAAQITAGTADHIVAIVRLNKDATAANIDMDDLSSEAQAGSVAGNIQIATTVTTGDKLLILWMDKTP